MNPVRAIAEIDQANTAFVDAFLKGLAEDGPDGLEEWLLDYITECNNLANHPNVKWATIAMFGRFGMQVAVGKLTERAVQRGEVVE